METKYTGAVAPAVMLLAAATAGRWRLWPAAALAAAQVFISWEFLTALLYGQSHFLQSLRASSGSLMEKGSLIVLFFSYLGGVAPFLFVLGLAALGARRRWQAAAAAAVVAGFALIVLFDARVRRHSAAVAAAVRLPSTRRNGTFPAARSSSTSSRPAERPLWSWGETAVEPATTGAARCSCCSGWDWRRWRTTR